ncbi:MAG: type IV secretion protein IcmK [Gammaproteobacteria bacterium]|jgi:intracellular multiplication protein IcmK|nr:type IV secretion protein IcmK [Gammaproteobacteria bacterium]
MKQNLKLLLLFLITALQPAHAAAVENPQAQGSSNALPMPSSNQNTGNTSSRPGNPQTANTQATNKQPSVQNTQSQTNSNQIAIPQDLSKLTPEQTNELMKQAKNLKPEQLQAIAKTLQSQPGVKQIDINSGLIEETVSAHGTTATQKATQQVVAAKTTQQAAPTANREISLDELKREQAFNSLMEEVLPLSPDQITKLHKFYDLTLQAKASTPSPSPTPNFTSIVVNLEPGSQPPVVRLSAGFVTSILFVDSTGSAWPVTAYSIGDPQNFNIQWDQKGNALFVQSLKQYSHGNLAVRLWGLDTPVMITLVSGQRNVDFRVDLQVGGRGPDAKPPIVDTTYNAKVNPLLINILDGIPPRGSIKLGVTGGYGEAWYADGRVYFRTKLTVLSPAWTATVASPDGTHVYEMMLTPFILASQNGKTIDIKLSGL